MKTWPASLPQGFLLSNSSSGLGDGRLRSQTDAGGAKVRRRFSYVPIPLAGSMMMTKAQLAIFRVFVETDLSGGIMPFQFPAQGEAGTWIVQFGEKLPSWSAVADHWEVSLDLLRLP